jgi:micrococcal nuclease
LYQYDATLVRVIDGDTLELVIDVGFRVAVRHVVRLAGINCAERDTDAGRAATRAVEAWFAEEGSRVVVKTRKAEGEQEKFGRYLAEVLSRHGADLVADLIAAGHAVRWSGRGVRP